MPSDCILIAKGRDKKEQSFLLIQNKTLIGYGYFNYHHQIKNLSLVSKRIIPISVTKSMHSQIKKAIDSNLITIKEITPELQS